MSVIDDIPVVALDGDPELDHFLSFAELGEEFPELSLSDWKAFARKLNISFSRGRSLDALGRHNRPQNGLMSTHVATIEETFRPKKAGEDIISLYKLARELNSSEVMLKNLVQKNNIAWYIYDFGHNNVGIGYDIVAKNQLRAFIAERNEKSAGCDVHDLASVRDKYCVGIRKLKRMLDDLGIVPQEYWFRTTWGYGITSEELTQFDEYFASRPLKKAPSNVDSVFHIARSNKMAKETLMALLDGIGMEPTEYLLHGIPVMCLSGKQVQKIKAEYAPEIMKQLLPVSINNYWRDNNIPRGDLMDLLEAAGIEPGMHPFGSRTAPGLTPDQMRELKETYAEFNLTD